MDKEQFGRRAHKYFKYITIASGLLLIRNIFWMLLKKMRSYPSGPIGLPFIGCLLQYGSSPRKFLVNIAIKYGAISYVQLLSSRNIFISDPKLLNKLYGKQEKIIDRASIHTQRIPSLWDLSGQIWEKRRKYITNSVLKVSKTSVTLLNIKHCIEKYIDPSMNKIIDNNELWYPSNHIYYISLNNILSATFGVLLSFDDPFIAKYSNLTKRFTKSVQNTILFDLMFNFNESISKWIKKRTVWKIGKEADILIIEWMRSNGFIIDPQQNILRRSNNKTKEKISNIYIDFVISKLNMNEITVYDIISDINVILGAATDTTSKSSQYGFLLLAKYPDIQQMVYNELQIIMKQNNLKQFDFNILNDLHVFRAFIHEVLRISSVNATGTPHVTNREHIIHINQKKIVIPKFTICHSNTYFIQKYLDWNDTNKVYKQENNEIHLDYWLNDGKFKVNDNFVLFGVGTRNCGGKSLALKAIYTIFGLMINKYKFKAENHNNMNIKQGWSHTLYIDPPIGIYVEKR